MSVCVGGGGEISINKQTLLTFSHRANACSTLKDRFKRFANDKSVFSGNFRGSIFTASLYLLIMDTSSFGGGSFMWVGR